MKRLAQMTALPPGSGAARRGSLAAARYFCASGNKHEKRA